MKIEDKFLNRNGYPQFRINIEKGEAHVDFKVFEVIAWSGDDKYDPVEEEMYLEARIFWDHHSHFNFGDLDKEGNHDGYLHICGADSMENHLMLMEYLYKLADEIRGEEPDEELEVKVVPIHEN